MKTAHKLIRVAPGSYRLGTWVISRSYDAYSGKWVAYDTANPLSADTFRTLRDAVASLRGAL